jgi:hypothetical protein
MSPAKEEEVRLLLILGSFLVLLLLTPAAQAQESGTIQATATVVSSLTVTGSNNLQFGSVTPGTPKAVDKTTIGSAGEWTITGTASAEVTLDFTLPTELSDGAAATMPITFSATDASYEDGSGGGQAAPAGVINPAVISTVDLSGAGEMTVWIGGTVNPGLAQTGGNYSADVVLTVTYTGG